MGYLSKLDAVNMMMLSAGESLVADLEEASGIDTGIAEFLLDQYSMEHQLRGIAENKFVKKFTLDADGKILLGYPNNDYLGVLEASLASAHFNDERILIRARVTETNPPCLYNMTDDTSIWKADTDYYVTITALLKWEHLDTVTQRAILSSAMRRYQIITQGDKMLDQVLAQEEMLTRIKARADNITDKKQNILNNAEAMQRYPRSYYNTRRFWNGGY
ncbi:MAG: hypothetical protein JHC33_04420 [Ignisphaera sp.]|nr:hypothetical protein [Ignisphaera sp.]